MQHVLAVAPQAATSGCFSGGDTFFHVAAREGCMRKLMLCLARLQRTAAAFLPLPLLQRILVQAGSLMY